MESTSFPDGSEERLQRKDPLLWRTEEWNLYVLLMIMMKFNEGLSLLQLISLLCFL